MARNIRELLTSWICLSATLNKSRNARKSLWEWISNVRPVWKKGNGMSQSAEESDVSDKRVYGKADAGLSNA